MAGGKGRDQDNDDHNVSMAQVHDLLEQQKAFFYKMESQRFGPILYSMPTQTTTWKDPD